jgi:2-succinyl-5-enolpyruvyl-6-hydroxy-3-cyclohexene-1-carboxylate synthase
MNMAGVDQVWANSAIEFCLRHEIDHFFLAPGSRCTPLTLAVARESCVQKSRIQVVQHFDERGLAFAALGYGRATGKPGVFICTSGTAVANAFPAVIEAAAENVPMLLFTADRPPELRGSGANQTIDQRDIFGGYPKLFVNMPVPDESFALEESLAQGFAATKNGPVHFNWMFREPFTISNVPTPNKYKPEAQASGSAATVEHKNDLKIKVNGNVLIALGSCNPFEAQQSWELSQYLNCPLLSDVTSGLRTGSLELPSEFELPVPDTILHLGGRIVSKTWHQWTATLPDTVDFHHITPTGQVINPNRLPVSQHRANLIQLPSIVSGPKTSESFSKKWSDAVAQRNDIVDQQLSDSKKLSEPAVAFHISKHCPTSHGLFVGNSTPIRDMDWFGNGLSDKTRNVAANRGASGIDGLLATATGYAIGLEQPTTVLIGDLSALHDLNSLSLVAKSPWPLIVLILNNQGGHIFDLLPIRESKHFEQFFATPHDCQFEYAAKMFGIDYRRITEMDDLAANYRDACLQNRSIVLELMTDRQCNMEVRNQIREEIQKCSSQS